MQLEELKIGSWYSPCNVHDQQKKIKEARIMYNSEHYLLQLTKEKLQNE